MKDFYAILGLERNASPEEIRAAYLALSKSLHPDVNPAGAGLMRAVNEAYETLKEPGKKRQYDLTLKVKAFVPKRPTVEADGTIDLLKLARGVVPVDIYNAAAPVVTRVLQERGIVATAATPVQILEAFGVLKPKRRAKRA